MKALGHQNFIVRTDSKVVRDHIEKDSEARKPELIEYLDAVRVMEKYFKGFDIVHIPRHMNDEAGKGSIKKRSNYLQMYSSKKSQNLWSNRRKKSRFQSYHLKTGEHP